MSAVLTVWRLRVVDADLAAHELGEEDAPVGGDVERERRARVLVERDLLEAVVAGAAAVAGRDAGRPRDAADDVLHERRLGVVGAEVAHRGDPRAAAVVGLAPRDRVVVAHRVATRVVRGLVHGGEHVGVAADVGREVVPLVRARPAAVEMGGGGVRLVLDDDLAGLAGARAGGGVAGHQRADQVVPPLVVAAHVGRVVDGHDAAAGLLVALHRRLLGRRPRVAGGLEHDQRVEPREVGVVEDRRVLGVLGGDLGLLERGADQRRALVDRLGVPELRSSR